MKTVMVEEADLSDELLEKLKAERINALISIVGGRGLSILYKLHRKGLNAVCIPRSIENDIAATAVSFGFNTALSFTIEMLDRVRQAARSARKIGVVEVLGEQSGWLALQAGIAVCADAVLIPEIPCDLRKVAATLKGKVTPRRPYGLVVVAEGAKFVDDEQAQAQASSLKASLSPLATGEASEHAFSDRVTQPGPWRASCNCCSPRKPIPLSWVPGSGVVPPPPSTANWGWVTGLVRYGH